MDLFCRENFDYCRSYFGAAAGGDAARPVHPEAPVDRSAVDIPLHPDVQLAIENGILQYLRKYNNLDMFYPERPPVELEPIYYFIDKSAPKQPGLKDTIFYDRSMRDKLFRRFLTEVTIEDIKRALIDDPQHIIDICHKYNERVKAGFNPGERLLKKVADNKPSRESPPLKSPLENVQEYLEKRNANAKTLRDHGLEPDTPREWKRLRKSGVTLKGGKTRKRKSKRGKSKRRKSKTRRKSN